MKPVPCKTQAQKQRVIHDLSNRLNLYTAPEVGRIDDLLRLYLRMNVTDRRAVDAVIEGRLAEVAHRHTDERTQALDRLQRLAGILEPRVLLQMVNLLGEAIGLRPIDEAGNEGRLRLVRPAGELARLAAAALEVNHER